MPELQFTRKPYLFDAITPVLGHYLLRFGVGGVVSYLLFWLIRPFYPVNMSALFWWLVGIVLFFSVLAIKARIITLSATRYMFYDTHIVREVRLVSVRKTSMPVKQIIKVTNHSSFWNRLTGASDIVLHVAHPERTEDFVLSSIKNADDVEHKIYALIKKKH